MGFRSTFSSAKSLFQSGPGYRANLAQIGKPYGSFGGMDSASELPDGVADLADGELADGVATKHGTVVHGLRLPRTTRCTKKMQLSATLGYIHCAAKDVIACVPVWPTSYPPLAWGAPRRRPFCLSTPRERGTQSYRVPVKRHRGTPGHTHGTHGTHGRTRAHFLFTGTVSLTSREVWSNGAFIPKQRSSCARMAREDTQPEPQRPGRSGEHSSETVDWLVAVTGGGKQ